nr:hypothetical protein [Pandoravirus aubagnensis]
MGRVQRHVRQASAHTPLTGQCGSLFFFPPLFASLRFFLSVLFLFTSSSATEQAISNQSPLFFCSRMSRLLWFAKEKERWSHGRAAIKTGVETARTHTHTHVFCVYFCTGPFCFCARVHLQMNMCVCVCTRACAQTVARSAHKQGCWVGKLWVARACVAPQYIGTQCVCIDCRVHGREHLHDLAVTVDVHSGSSMRVPSGTQAQRRLWHEADERDEEAQQSPPTRHTKTCNEIKKIKKRPNDKKSNIMKENEKKD